MSAVSRLEAKVGRRLAAVMWYEHWAGPSSQFVGHDFEAVLAQGAVPVLTWMSDDPTAAGYPLLNGQTAYTCRAIASGVHDAYVRRWAVGIRGLRMPVMVRLDHEMNGDWYAWSPGVNGNTPADYVAMWRHVHGLFAAEGATNVRWVWSPNVAYGCSTSIAECYPGDDFVDWVALDGYNWGDDGHGHTWHSLVEVFASTYLELTLVTSKPLMIAETASVEAADATAKAEWISAGFAELTRALPKVEALIWFDQQDGGSDFRIASSAGSLAAFRAAVSDPHVAPKWQIR